MNKLISIILLISISMNVMAQVPIKNDSCNFFKNVRFKNGLDTLVIKTTYLEVAKMIPIDRKYETLDKAKKIKSEAFTYQLGFRPEGCEKIYYAPCSYKGNTTKLKPGAIFFVTCIVFERRDLEYQGVPFFVIVKIATGRR